MLLLRIFLLSLVCYQIECFVCTAEKFVEAESKSQLFSHRPQLKAVKKIAFTRPKKTRRSDIYRRNVNLNKCLEQHPDNLGKPDFTVIEPEDLEKAIEEYKDFLIHGSREDPWYDVPQTTDYVSNGAVGLPPDGPKMIPLRKNKAVGARVNYPKPWL